MMTDKYLCVKGTSGRTYHCTMQSLVSLLQRSRAQPCSGGYSWFFQRFALAVPGNLTNLSILMKFLNKTSCFTDRIEPACRTLPRLSDRGVERWTTVDCDATKPLLSSFLPKSRRCLHSALVLHACRKCRDTFDEKCLGPGRARALERLEKAWNREMRRYRSVFGLMLLGNLILGQSYKLRIALVGSNTYSCILCWPDLLEKSLEIKEHSLFLKHHVTQTPFSTAREIFAFRHDLMLELCLPERSHGCDTCFAAIM